MKKSGGMLVAVLAIIAAALVWSAPAKADYLGDQYWDHVDWFTIHMNGDGIVEEPPSTGSGWNLDGQSWFYYQGNTDNAGWWTQWFYDGVYDPNRYKQIHVEFSVHGYPEGEPIVGQIEMSLNWTTPLWSSLGMERPPLPQDFYSPAAQLPESAYIGRSQILLDLTEYDLTQNDAFFSFDYTIPLRYGNPEWVSLDFRGYNFGIGSAVGTIAHSCLPIPEPGTLTLLGLGLVGLVARRRMHL